jgi:hypothetical protein
MHKSKNWTSDPKPSLSYEAKEYITAIR